MIRVTFKNEKAQSFSGRIPEALSFLQNLRSEDRNPLIIEFSNGQKDEYHDAAEAIRFLSSVKICAVDSNGSLEGFP